MQARACHVAMGTLLCLGAAARTGVAQWGVGIEVQRVAFGGTSLDTTAADSGLSFRPSGTATLGIRVDRRFGRFRPGLLLRYARAALLIDRKSLYLGEPGDFTLVELAPELSYRLAATHTGATAHVYFGPVVSLWGLAGADPRLIPGVRAGLGGEFPLSGRFSVWLRAGGAMTRSVFKDGELPAEFARRATSRSEIAVGLRYGH